MGLLYHLHFKKIAAIDYTIYGKIAVIGINV